MKSRQSKSLALRLASVLMLLLGLVSVASSWLSIKPSSERRIERFWERVESDPDSVENHEYIMMEDDEGMTAIVHIIVGIPMFLVFTLLILLLLKKLLSDKSDFRWVWLGLAWIALGGYYHWSLWAE